MNNKNIFMINTNNKLMTSSKPTKNRELSFKDKLESSKGL